MIGDYFFIFMFTKSAKTTKKKDNKCTKSAKKVPKSAKMVDFIVTMLLSALVERVSVSNMLDFSVKEGGWV